MLRVLLCGLGLLVGSAAGVVLGVESPAKGDASTGAEAAESLAKFVDEQVREWEIQPAERRFDEIGWSRSLLEAKQLAAEYGRPVFLFTHDGRIAIGRC